MTTSRIGNRIGNRIGAALMALLVAGGIGEALAQAFPAKPVNIVVPAAPGGAADASLRLIAPKVAENLRQQIVIESRPGANGVVGAMAVRQAAPDGYTLLVGHLGLNSLAPFLIANLPFDSERDFRPVTTISLLTPFLAVPSSSPARTVAELFAHAKAKPKGLFFGHPGAGTASHLLPEMMKMSSNLDFSGVAYKGAAALIGDLVEGRLDLYFGSLNVVLPQVDGGRLRILAVGATQRWEQLPLIPTMAESGYPGHDLEFWFGLFAPAGTPNSVISVLQREFARVLADPEIKLAYAKQGWRAGGATPEQFAKLVVDDRERWGRVIKQIGLKPE